MIIIIGKYKAILLKINTFNGLLLVFQILNNNNN